MKAIRIHEYGDVDVLKYEEAPVPEIGPDEVLIRVHSAAVNPVDWKVRKGFAKERRPYRLPLILGWDLSGTIERVGVLVTRLKAGDKVFSRPDLGRNGSYAEYIAVRADEVAFAPKSLPLEKVAGVPLAALTAWMALFEKAGLRAGQSVLIHAAAGGVGTFAVQLAKLAGAHVIGTASAGNTELVKSLGADDVIDYRAVDFTTKVKNVDVVLDAIGGDTQKKSLQALKPGGFLSSIVGPVDSALAQQFGVQTAWDLVKGNGARLQEIADLIDARKLKVIIEKEFPLSEVKAAHELSETNRVRGKIILRVS